MNALVEFMNTMPGRALRVVLGLVIVYLGLAVVGGVLGWVVALVGLVQIVMGAIGHCLLEFLAPKTRRA